ncbi:hypothetical protein BOX15_Mlig021248g2, partial [Macrostomum lignano]
CRINESDKTGWLLRAAVLKASLGTEFMATSFRGGRGRAPSIAPGSSSLRMMIDTEDPLFQGMKKLKIQGRNLTAVPPELFNLSELEVLDMSPEREACLYYKLADVPTAICKLKNLRILLLDTNDLAKVPGEIGLLENLERLALSNNWLSSLPPEIGDLTQLKSIHLANNKFVHFPAAVLRCTQMEFLDISDNMLQKVPKAIRRLTNLETLMVFSNQLRGLPDEICDLVQLRCVWLGFNKVANLPKNFGRLKLLDWSWHYTSTILNENPLVHPPLEICKQGADEIERYFAMLGSSADRMLYRQEDDTAEDLQAMGPDAEAVLSSRQPAAVTMGTPQSGPSTQRSQQPQQQQASPPQQQPKQPMSLDINPAAVRLLRRGSTSDPSFLQQLQSGS